MVQLQRENENLPSIGVDLRLNNGVRHCNRRWGAMADSVEKRGGVGYQKANWLASRVFSRRKKEHVSKQMAEDADELLAGGKASSWWGLFGALALAVHGGRGVVTL